MGIVELLIMLAQGDARVVRVPVPTQLHAGPPAACHRLLEGRTGRRLERLLCLHTRARVLEARAGDLVLKKYLVGVGPRLAVHGGGLYALDGEYAYVVDPAEGGLALRDQDADELREYAPPGTRLVVTR